MQDPSPSGPEAESVVARMRQIDWQATPLGPSSEWTLALRSPLDICLDSSFPIAIYWGPQRALLYNEAWSPILGDKHPWALGRPAPEVWPEIWETIGPMFDQVFETGVATRSHDQLLPMHRHGFTEECWFDYTFSPLRDGGGQVAGVFNVVLETTARHIGERRTRLLSELGEQLSRAQDAEATCTRAASVLAGDPHDLPFVMLYLFDPDGAPRCVAAAGIDAMTEPDGNAWPVAEALSRPGGALVEGLSHRFGAGLFAGPWPEPCERALVVALPAPGVTSATGASGVLVAGISPRLALDGEYRAFVERAAGTIGAAIARARAIQHERARAEALAELDRAKTSFFSNISHELRTPLALMLGPIDDVLRATADAEVRESMALALRNGLRLQRLVNTLLDFSRIEAGRMQASFEPVDLAATTADLASVFRSAIEKAGLRLSIDCPPLPEPVFVDRGMWEKIVFNLLSNAFKFTLKGSIRVSLAADVRGARLVVGDTGAGIPRAAQARLFERFYRVEGAQGRSIEGSGIGLALVHELARLHGGEAGVSSEPGLGSEFSVLLPFGCTHLPAEQVRTGRGETTMTASQAWLDEAEGWLGDTPHDALHDEPIDTASKAFDDAPTAPSDRALPTATQAAPRARVLVADDNTDMRGYLVRLLGREHDVVAAADGLQALQAARRQRPDLIVTDLMMPRLDGLGLLRELRADPALSTTPVILLSARAGDEARIEGLHAGADDYITKPFHARELLARTSGMLALTRARGALAASNSALRESEQSFRELAEAMPQIVYVTDARGQAEYLNAQWREFTGQTAAQHDLDAAVHPDDLPRLRSQWQYALDQGTMLTSEFRLRRHDGEHQWVLTRATPVRDEQGHVTRWFGTSTNIDAHKRRAEALMRAHQQLQVSERRKDEFLATLAHELRNPLAPLRHALQLLQGGSDPSAAATLHAMMQRQVDQLVRLVDDLLEVARINHGKIEIDRQPVLLGGVLDSAIETCRPLIDQTGVRLELRADIADLVVEGDALRLAQVFVNLLNNAAKYSHPGGRVVITARRDGEEAVVSLRDEGIGIAPEMLPRVFDIFVQAPGAAVHAADGLGIGLSLVSTLLGLHGGRIEARSEGVGHGSEFIVRLPALAGQTAMRPAAQATAPTDHEAPIGAIEVLVCDDNRDAADSLGDLLRVLGAKVRVVYDGPAALAAVQQQRPQLVLLDIGMPGMDGHAVARALRALPEGPSPMTLAALTGWAQPQDRERTRASGFDQHFVKPIDIDALRSLMDTVAQAASTEPGSIGWPARRDSNPRPPA